MYTHEDIKNTDELGMMYWVYITKPIVQKMTFLFANYTKFTPNQITIGSLIFGLISVPFFLKGTWIYLVIGALLFEISFLLDYCDGRIARLKGLKSTFGGYLDIMTDMIRYFLITLGLVYGQYYLTKDISFFIYGYVFIFLLIVYLANTYIIRHHQPELGMSRKDVYKMRYDILRKKMPFIMKIKTKLDPHDQLIFIPNDAETIGFFIFPLIMQIKLGFIIGSIILLTNIVALIIFNFRLKEQK
jgi:phosphatidylglycerophosphate synthase